MTRSLSLTDLVQPRERYRHRSSTKRPYCQNRGYVSDDDYYSPQHTDQVSLLVIVASFSRNFSVEIYRDMCSFSLISIRRVEVRFYAMAEIYVK